IVENGKADGVDGVAGATLCSTAIRDGVNACTAQALGLPAAPAPLNPQVEDYKSFDGDCAEVFSSIKLGSMTLPNRIAKSAGSAPWADAGKNKITVACELYGAMADNGVSLNIVASGALSGTGILPTSLDAEGDPDENLAKAKPLTDRIHQAGGKIGCQVCFYGGAPTYPDSVINETPIEELEQYIENVGISAQRVVKAGFDCIEVKGASGDALNGFLSRRVNCREDEYGPQSIENRTRLFCQIIRKIKEVNGADFPVGALINAVEENDVSLGDNDLFLTIEETKEIAKALEDAGADWIQVRVGANGQEMNIWAPDVQHMAPGVNGLTGYGTMFDYSSHFGGLQDGSRSGFASFLPMVKAIKEAVKVPVGCAAYMDLRVGPDYLNDAIKRGDIDLIFMNRPLNCDPELVRKIQEGKREDVRPCMKCMHCHDNNSTNRKYPSSCRMNATSFNSLTDVMPEGAVPTPAAAKKNVMVIGAGPAGLEAARVAAERGHSVTLYDSADKLGGLLHFARGVKGDHEHFEDYFTYAAYQMEKLGVNVQLRTRVDAALVKEQKPDAVIVAVGGIRESKLSGTNVFSPEGAFGSAKLGERVVILGAAVQAVDFAAYLVSKGKKVTMVHSSPADDVDKGQSGWFRIYMLSYLQANGVKIFHNASAKSVSDASLTITTDVGLEKAIPCDSVVEFYDMVPNTALAKELETAGFEVHSVGDCAAPHNIQKAVLSGNLAARSL
ncbi:MAG: FAD-dependent oxidoreductase, partial [Oscillospiraceae bacterium]|nr:FAD-dependent oxidoreductase [Oscillospiraceae bacterium]